MKYKIVVKNKSDEKIELILPFENERQLSKYIQENSLEIIKLSKINRRFQINNKKKLSFIRELKILMENDINILEALKIIAEKEENIYFKGILLGIIIEIENGKSIQESFREFGQEFGEGILIYIIIGENTNRIVENLEQIERNLEFELEVKKQVVEILIYPVVVLIFSVGLVIFMLTYVFPNFISLFEDSNVKLPLITRVLIFLNNKMLTIFGIVGVFGIIGTLYYKYKLNSNLEKIYSKIPILKGFYKELLQMTFTKTMSNMLQNKLNFVNALEIIKEIIGNSEYSEKINVSIKYIKEGKGIVEAFEKSKLLEKDDLKLLVIGEKSGDMSCIFDTIYGIKSNKFQENIKRVLVLLEPSLILILGIIIGGIILGIYLPIFNLSETIL